jgi:hypothetical protein
VERTLALYLRERDFVDWYAILGVEADASSHEVRDAYREIGAAVHPTNNPHPDAPEAFHILQEALEAVNSPARRTALDQALATRSSPIFVATRTLRAGRTFAMKLASRLQLLARRVREGEHVVELQELQHCACRFRDTGVTLVENFMELPSLHDKLQYMGEAVSDHCHAVAVVGGVTSFVAVRRMIRAVLSRRATRSALWKRTLLRRQSSASPHKTIFGAGDDSPIRMLI